MSNKTMRQVRDAAPPERTEPVQVLTGEPVAYIPRSALRSILSGRLGTTKVFASPRPGDYALIAVPQEGPDD